MKAPLRLAAAVWLSTLAIAGGLEWFRLAEEHRNLAALLSALDLARPEGIVGINGALGAAPVAADRDADFCMVTALHDGMNLVAKEFISVRDDEDGALILSRFTGASSELREALLVNPYDVDAMADAIHAAVTMPEEERRGRMARMRKTVRENNIYRWAGLLLGDLSRVPDEIAKAPTSLGAAA